MNNIIAILEDDRRRSEEMNRVVAQHFPDFQCIVFDNSHDIIEWLKDSLETVCLISLDHDLDPFFQRNGKVCDPGTGRDVADFLATQTPICPVIVHTTNRFGGDGMKFALDDCSWVNDRVVPMQDLLWISTDWLDKLSMLIEGNS